MNDLLRQAEAAHRSGNLDRADELYRQALASNPRDSNAIYGIATIAMGRRDYDSAINFFREALTIEPDAADIQLNYALALQGSGQLSEAAKVAVQVAAIAGHDPAFARPLAKILIDCQRPDAAVSLLLRQSRLSRELEVLLATAYGLAGQWDDAVSRLRALHQQYQQDPDIARELSLAAGKLRDYELAIDAYGRYLELIQPEAHHFLKFADLYLIARDSQRSREQLDKARALGADSDEYFVLDARLARLEGDRTKLRSACESALAKNPNQGQAWSALLESLTVEELPDWLQRAEASIDFASNKPYYNTLIQYAFGSAYDRLDELDMAFHWFEQANQLQGSLFDKKQKQYEDRAAERLTTELIQDYSKSKPLLSSTSTLRPVFIVGMPRSGTTLLERMLGQIDAVSSLGEHESMGFIGAKYRRQREQGQLPAPAGLRQDHWQAMADEYCASLATEAKVVTDKMPHNFNHVGLILSMFPEARVLQMRRDPRDTCFSIYCRSFPDGHNYACSQRKLAHAYKQCEVLMDHWLEYCPQRVMDVDYEALVDQPEAWGRRITEFCGLEWSEECLNFHRRRSSSHTFSEMQVRESINSKGIGRWRRYSDHLGPLLSAMQDYGVRLPRE